MVSNVHMIVRYPNEAAVAVTRWSTSPRAEQTKGLVAHMFHDYPLRFHDQFQQVRSDSFVVWGARQ